MERSFITVSTTAGHWLRHCQLKKISHFFFSFCQYLFNIIPIYIYVLQEILFLQLFIPDSVCFSFTENSSRAISLFALQFMQEDFKQFISFSFFKTISKLNYILLCIYRDACRVHKNVLPLSHTYFSFLSYCFNLKHHSFLSRD